MKKAKIMLTALTVLAVVGGALAFEAQKYGSNGVCFTYTDASDTEICPVGTILSFSQLGSSTVYYRTTSNINNCNQETLCTSSTTVEFGQ